MDVYTCITMKEDVTMQIINEYVSMAIFLLLHCSVFTSLQFIG